MERHPNTPAMVEAFRLASRTSPFLPKLLPLLELNEDIPVLRRISQSPEGLQILMNNGADHQSDYAQLCLTLTRRSLALTVATDYNLGKRTNNISRSTLVIESKKHTDHVMHKFNGVTLGTYYDKDAIERFTPELEKTLRPLGLDRL